VCFTSIGVWLSERVGVWSEEISTYPTGPNRAVVAGPGDVPEVESCAGGLRLRESAHRPELALCAMDRSWPIMVAPYISGWVYWPFGAVLPSDVFILRKLGLALGILTLLLGYWIVSRVKDAEAAAAGALATAFASPFVLAHALLVHYELLPLPLVLGASAIFVGELGRDEMRPGRAALAGALLGLAIAADIKAVFLIGSLAILAWRTKRTPVLGDGARRALALGVGVPLVPMAGFALLGSGGGFSGQIWTRIANVVGRLTSPGTLLEPLNMLTYWTDVAAYGDQAVHTAGTTHLLPLVLPALTLVHVTVELVSALRGRPHDALAAAFGALLFFYLLAGALLYAQEPAANYAPLHAVFGFATAHTAVVLGRSIADRLRLSRTGSSVLVGAFVLATVLGFGFHTLRRGDPAGLPISTNAVAQRAVVRHLEDSPGGTVVTASYNLAGVVDSISSGNISTVHVATYVAGCGGGEVLDPDERACREDRWHRVVDALGTTRLLLPTARALSDEPEVDHVLPALRALEARGAITVEEEAAFGGVATGPVLALHRLRSTRTP
jgi:hypothetical protein